MGMFDIPALGELKQKQNKDTGDIVTSFAADEQPGEIDTDVDVEPDSQPLLGDDGY